MSEPDAPSAWNEWTEVTYRPPDPGRRHGERERIRRVIARDGLEEAREWARRTAAQYRAAVLDRAHFAHAGGRRRQFIEAYLELKRFANSGQLPT